MLTPQQQRKVDKIVKDTEFYADKVQRQYRRDDPDGLFARQLVIETVQELFRFEYTAINWISGGLIPINTSLNEGASSYAFTEIEQIGEAEIVSSNPSDIPLATVAGRNNILPIEQYAIACEYSTQDVRTARFQGTFDIVTEKVAAAREGHDRRLNRDILRGVNTHGLRGVINQPGIIVQAATTGSWTDATAVDDIITDIRTALNFMFTDSRGVEQANHGVYALGPWTVLNRRLGDGTDAILLDVVKKQFPLITRWDFDPELADAVVGSREAVYYSNDTMKMRAQFPMMMKPLPVQMLGLSFILPFESRFGGIMTPRPRSVLHQTGL